ncbi:hypothetical protein Ancab_007622 [Ancistrocladus abbreviatus]
MNQRFHSCGLILFLLFLVAISKAPASLVATNPGDGVKLNEITGGRFDLQEEDDDSVDLVGLEACKNGDEECLKRRITEEAHLDYIYTQHQKP